MPNLDDRLAETFAPIAVPADPPGMPVRSHHMQQSSDALRDAARAFAKRFVGLVPDAAFHGCLLDVLHDLVVEGERRIEAVLESRADFASDGFHYGLEHAEPRTELRFDDVKEAEPEGESDEAKIDRIELELEQARLDAARPVSSQAEGEALTANVARLERALDAALADPSEHPANRARTR